MIDLPESGPATAIRDGKYSLVAHRSYKFPHDRKQMASLMKQIEDTLRKDGTFETEIRGSTFKKTDVRGLQQQSSGETSRSIYQAEHVP